VNKISTNWYYQNFNNLKLIDKTKMIDVKEIKTNIEWISIYIYIYTRVCVWKSECQIYLFERRTNIMHRPS